MSKFHLFSVIINIKSLGRYNMNCNVMAVKLDKRVQNATKVQEVLTQHGCLIQNRMGIHEANENACSDCGMIILTLLDKQDEITKLKSALEQIEGVKSALITL